MQLHHGHLKVHNSSDQHLSRPEGNIICSASTVVLTLKVNKKFALIYFCVKVNLSDQPIITLVPFHGRLPWISIFSHLIGRNQPRTNFKQLATFVFSRRLVGKHKNESSLLFQGVIVATSHWIKLV